MPASSTGRARTSSSSSRRRRQSGRRCCFRAKGGRATARARSVPTTPADRAWTSTCRTCIRRLEPISTHSPIFLITCSPPWSARTDTVRRRADAPHRFLARGRAYPLRNWLLVGVLDWRSGLPYSVVNEWLDFVGPRNDHRFPTYKRVDFGVEHRFKIRNSVRGLASEPTMPSAASCRPTCRPTSRRRPSEPSTIASIASSASRFASDRKANLLTTR